MKLALVLSALCLSACNRVPGERAADEMNRVVVARIKSGECTLAQLMDEAFLRQCRNEALRNLGYNNPEEAKITDAEREKFEARIAVYQKQWLELVNSRK